MDFAKKQLEKYGWKEGQGLGKEGNEGIPKAIKPHYKTGKAGMGFDLAEELTDTWWTRAYDDCLRNVSVQKDPETGAAKVEAGLKEDGEACSDAPHIRMNKRLMKANFCDFNKGGTLDNGKVIEEPEAPEEPAKKKKKKTVLSDEDLFKACGGRTAHKGARHGLKLSGKLARLAAQDAYLTAHPEKLKPSSK